MGFGRLTLRVVLGLGCAAALGWMALAIYYSPLQPAWLRAGIAALVPVGAVVALLLVRPLWRVLAGILGAFIVSGGGIEFMRPWTERVYGIPPEQVVGSSGKLRFELRDGNPVLVKLPEIDFIDDKAGKPVGIHKFIGRRPILAFGNSDGDLQMLQWTAAGTGPRFMAIVHHTDTQREWAYDRNSSIGRVDKALDEANAKGWAVVDMKRDWKVVFPFEKK